MTLTPACGRDYTSKARVLADFNADKDFIIADIMSPWDGKPANKTTLKAAGIRRVNIRYKCLMQVMTITL